MVTAVTVTAISRKNNQRHHWKMIFYNIFLMVFHR